MKALTIICLTLCFSLILSSPITEQGREFLQNFFEEAQFEKGFKLSDKCLGENFEKDLAQLGPLLDQETVFAIPILAKILKELQVNCPINNAISIMNSFKWAIDNGRVQQNAFWYHATILDLLKEMFEAEDISIGRLGYIGGNILHTLTWGRMFSTEANFLAVEEKTEDCSENLKKLFKGIIKGTSKTPFENNKCVKSLIPVASKLVMAFNDAIVFFTKTKSFIQTYHKLMEDLKNIGITLDMEGCNFAYLHKELHDSGVMRRVTARISKNLEQFKNEGLYAVANGFGQRDYELVGSGLGKMLSIALAYETE